MTKKIYNFRAEEQLMDEFASIAKELGTNKTALLNMMITAAVKQHRAGAFLFQFPAYQNTQNADSNQERPR